MRVEDVMSGSVVTLTSEETLRDALNVLRSNRVRHLPLVDDSKVVWIVTDRDVKHATPSILSGVRHDGYDMVLATTKVAQFMTRDLIAVTPQTTLKAAGEVFLERKLGTASVVEEGRLVGIPSEMDILRVAHDLLPD